MIRFVIGPIDPDPIGSPSILVTGMTSPAVEVIKTLSACLSSLGGPFRHADGKVHADPRSAEAGRTLEEVMLPLQRAAMPASFQCRESLWILGKGREVGNL